MENTISNHTGIVIVDSNLNNLSTVMVTLHMAMKVMIVRWEVISMRLVSIQQQVEVRVVMVHSNLIAYT